MRREKDVTDFIGEALEYNAREAGFTWGMFCVLAVVLPWMYLDNHYDLETLTAEHKFLNPVVVVSVLLLYKGIKWVGVERFDPNA